MSATLVTMSNSYEGGRVKPASPGKAIAARRKYLGLTQPDVVERTNNVINGSLLTRLETDRKSPGSLSLSKYNALVAVLQWTNEEFKAATGVAPVSQSLPNIMEYLPSSQIPIVGSVSAGLASVGGDMEGLDTLPVDLNAAGLQNVNPRDLVWMRVNGDSMISETVSKALPHGALVLVEVNAVPQNSDVVVAWLENRETAVIKQYRESADVILRSYNPRGPLFRLEDEPVDVRGVVRLVQYKPGA